MKSKSLIQVIFSLILVAFLTITSVIISPQAAVAITSSNTPLESLTTGMELQEQGDLDRAATLYQEAIESIFADEKSEFYTLISAIEYLGIIKEVEGKQQEADELYQEVDTIVDQLKLESVFKFDLNCDNNCGRGHELKFGKCIRCPRSPI